MARKRRGGKTALLAAYLLTGALVLQIGPMCSMLTTFGAAAFDFSTLLDENERFLGVFAPCGVPNTITVDEQGIPTGEVQNSEDDLIFDCPVTQIVDTTA